MRILRGLVHLVALGALGTIAVAFGRWLRDPGVDGSLAALLVLTGLTALALRRLYGPGGFVAFERRGPEASAPAPAPVATEPPSPDRLWSPVDLNTGSLGELRSLPGVGRVAAQRIVDARPFASVDDLERVPGFGPARVRALRDRLRV